MISAQQVKEREERLALPTALATMVGVVLVIASAIALGSVNGDGDAELLRSAHDHSSAVTISGVLQALGFVLLIPGLVFLFRAALARSNQMRGQLIGVVVAAPIFLAGFAICNAVATSDAASDFANDPPAADLSRKDAAQECRSDRDDQGAQSFRDDFGGRTPAATFAACVRTKIADDQAQSAVDDASLRPLALGFGFAGRLGLAAVLVYTGLWAMRTGLMTRFWGSLGMALGLVSFLVLQFTLIWFIYVALLIAGWVPGGRPPAWAAGEGIPWPSPGEEKPSPGGDAVAGSGREVPDEGDAGEAPAANGPRRRGERRKRKQRR